MTKQEKQQVALETSGSILWFLMDAFWMLEWELGAILLVLPTAITNLWIFRHTEKSVPQMSITAAMNCWVLMNSLWMVDDFKKIPALLITAKIFFVLGLFLLLLAFLKSDWRKEAWQTVMSRFRRLRIAR